MYTLGRNLIKRSEDLNGGVAVATIKDVAKLAGVAISTVSYALNDSTRISQATKDKE